MTAKILDGKAIAAELVNATRQRVAEIEQQHGYTPGLAVVLLGNDPASEIYVRNKHLACERAGINSIGHAISTETTEAELLALVDELNNDASVDGILVQMPLPAHIDPNKVIERIHPGKDVDGFHPYNLGRLAQRNPVLQPCTPRGIMTLLEHTGESLVGKDAIVIGASNVVGRPMTLELLMARCTVTTCHSATQKLAEKVAQADIVVAAVGIAELVKGDWIKPGAIVIDVGMNRSASGKLLGDVEFAAAAERASWITPVPGGVGPMTVATLIQNTLDAALMRLG
jgi:methylenetetrahydrofolate dehydrogenase (NADP+)/methenyltetrahydrofolate cyclohydrolase